MDNLAAHRILPIAFDLPEGWEPLNDLPTGAAIGVIARFERDGFRPNVIVYLDQLDPAMPIDEALSARLPDAERQLGVDLDGNIGKESAGTIAGHESRARITMLTGRGATLAQLQIFLKWTDVPPTGAAFVQVFGTTTEGGVELDAPVFQEFVRSLRPAVGGTPPAAARQSG